MDIDSSNLLIEVVGLGIAGLSFIAGRLTSKEGKALISFIMFLSQIYRWYLATHPQGKTIANTTTIDEELDKFQDKNSDSEEILLLSEEEAPGLG